MKKTNTKNNVIWEQLKQHNPWSLFNFTVSLCRGNYSAVKRSIFFESDYHFRCGEGAWYARWYSNEWTFRQSRIVCRTSGSGTIEAVPFNETLAKGETIDVGRGEGCRIGTGCCINREHWYRLMRNSMKHKAYVKCMVDILYATMHPE